VVNGTTKVAKTFFHAVLSEAELASLQQKFKPLLKYKDVMLEFCYEHVFNGEIYKNGRLGGMHHDYQGMLKKSGILKLRNIKKFANGYYEAEIWCEKINKWIPKTFFPDHYTRENVMKKIVEALKNVQFTEQKGLRTVIDGLSSDSITIRTIIEKAKGITAYPYLGK